MCVRCLGTGQIYTVNEDEMFKDKTKTLANLFDNEGKEGATKHYGHRINEYCKLAGLSPQQTIDSLSEDEFYKFKYGGIGYKHMDGVVPWAIQFKKWSMGRKYGGMHLPYVYQIPCPKCNGSGLGEHAHKIIRRNSYKTRVHD